ncbi:hypothetical protein NDU88_004768 [Pleurodeles waltl]|uniref:Uncharacterized protein n=1 Tax=Pleurodeles waltl TaxID=8319 RepID=A0AAV7M951_PLEWA|nr:hypothetical protein NDU88_004768 [Pleurodeles waltl]
MCLTPTWWLRQRSSAYKAWSGVGCVASGELGGGTLRQGKRLTYWSLPASLHCDEIDERQRLYHEGDRSGHMLAWLLKRERPLPTILSLQGPIGERYLGQVRANLLLRDHLKCIHTLPKTKDGGQVCGYLDRLHIPRLTEVQTEKLEGEVMLEEQQDALGAMAHGPDRPMFNPSNVVARATFADWNALCRWPVQVRIPRHSP